MTKEEVSNFTAGPSLDLAIALHLFKWDVLLELPAIAKDYPPDIIEKPFPWYMPRGSWEPGGATPLTYSTNVAHAYSLLKHFEGYVIEKDGRSNHSARLRRNRFTNYWGQANAETVEVAICRAALLALIADDIRESQLLES